MKKLLLLLGLVSHLSFSNTLDNTQWKLLGNARFDFCRLMPKTFKAGVVPANGDGRTFFHEDIEINSFGSHYLEAMDITFKDYYLKGLKVLKTDKARVIYKVFKTNFFVISGITADNKVFYEKSLWQTGKPLISLHIRYDSNHPAKAKIDKMVEVMANSLKYGYCGEDDQSVIGVDQP